MSKNRRNLGTSSLMCNIVGPKIQSRKFFDKSYVCLAKEATVHPHSFHQLLTDSCCSGPCFIVYVQRYRQRSLNNIQRAFAFVRRCSKAKVFYKEWFSSFTINYSMLQATMQWILDTKYRIDTKPGCQMSKSATAALVEIVWNGLKHFVQISVAI